MTWFNSYSLKSVTHGATYVMNSLKAGMFDPFIELHGGEYVNSHEPVENIHSASQGLYTDGSREFHIELLIHKDGMSELNMKWFVVGYEEEWSHRTLLLPGEATHERIEAHLQIALGKYLKDIARKPESLTPAI